jgi:hypothetical protein
VPNIVGVDPGFQDILALQALQACNHRDRVQLGAMLMDGATVLEVGPCKQSRTQPWLPLGTAVRLITLDVCPDVAADIHGDVADLHRVLEGHPAAAPAGGFHAIICQEVLEHAGMRTRAIMEEIVGCLAPGGLVLVSGPFNFRLHGPAVDGQRVTEHGFRQLAADNGLEVVGLWSCEFALRPLCPVHTSMIARKR